MPGVLRLPSGRLVRGRALARPLPAGPVPSFGLYLLGDEPPAVQWEARWVRWPDFGLPADPAAAETVLREAWVRAAAERVEVACHGGNGRTGTALACLAVLDGVPARDAVRYVRAHYAARAVETPRQRRFVARFPPGPVELPGMTLFDLRRLAYGGGFLHGLVNDQDRDLFALHVHGTGGSFYRLTISTALTDAYLAAGADYATVNVPGTGNEAAYEVFTIPATARRPGRYRRWAGRAGPARPLGAPGGRGHRSGPRRSRRTPARRGEGWAYVRSR
jgi:hypothetical protein